MTRIDHDTFVGGYPFRSLPEPTAGRLVSELDRHGIAQAWTGHLPSAWYRDVAAGNDELLRWLAPHRERLQPVPCVKPGWPGWEREIARARREGAPAVRTYPHHHGVAAAGTAMAELAAACAGSGLVLVLTVRFEDGRQRSRLDMAGDLIGADVRAVVRAHPAVQVLVTAADRALVEEVHFGSTAEEAARVRYDISWIWGEPEDHIGLLQETVGAGRFVFGSQWPLRLMESALVRAGDRHPR